MSGVALRLPFTRATLLGLALLMTGVEVPSATAAGTDQSQAGGSETSAPASPAPVGLANPAAVFCIKSGGKHVIRKAADGSEDGTCVFPDGREANAWDFFRAHAPKD